MVLWKRGGGGMVEREGIRQDGGLMGGEELLLDGDFGGSGEVGWRG